VEEEEEGKQDARQGKAPSCKCWAFGLEDEKRWQVFFKERYAWKHKRLLVNLRGGMPSRLLKAFADGNGCLILHDAIRKLYPGFVVGEAERLKDRITQELSRLRKTIRMAIGDKERKTKPFLWDENIKGWRAEVEIGFAVKGGDQQAQRGDQLRFLTNQELQSQ
jgi:hypothetical protein